MQIIELIKKLLTSSPFNLVINNLFWVGCVVGRYEMIYLVAPAIIIYTALLLYAKTLHLPHLLAIIGVGILIDSFYTATGLFKFDQSHLLLPLWMCMLWVAFATTLPLSLRLAGKSSYLAAATGAIGFPFSYYLGAKFGAVSFSLPFPGVAIILAVTWAIVLPIMFYLINRPKIQFNEAF